MKKQRADGCKGSAKGRQKRRSEVVRPLRVLGEPAFAHTLLLLEDFLDGPEGGEGEDAKKGGYEDVFRAEGGDDTADAQQQEEPPAPRTPIVFGLHDDGVEQADDEEGADADEKTRQMIGVQKIHNHALKEKEQEGYTSRDHALRPER